MAVLRVKEITAGYGGVPVISHVSIEVNPGSVVAIVGANGAGKSTLLKAVFGLLPQTEGSVVIDGLDVSGWEPHRLARHGLAYVPQVDNIFPSMSVSENLEMGGFVRREGVRRRIAEVLGIFPDLQASSRRKAGELSGGQRNILAMGRALMLDPKVVLLDEPTAGLAPNNVARVWEQVRRVVETGTAVVVVEQNVDLAIEQADWVYVLVSGRNRLEGPASDVAQQDLRSIFLGLTPQPDATGHASN